MLGNVDPYDDTVFNRSQIPAVLAEIESLKQASTPANAEVAAELTDLITLTSAQPHRYLVFNGD
jgi:hypothetical protein